MCTILTSGTKQFGLFINKRIESSAANKDNIFLNTNLKLIGKGLHCYITDGNDFIIVESGSPLFSKSPGYTFNGLKGIYNSSKKHEITSGVPGEEVNAEIEIGRAHV